MRIERYGAGEVVILGVRGRLVGPDSATRIRLDIKNEVVQGNRKLVLDLGRLTRIDSQALDTLLNCLRCVRGCGGELKLAAVTRRLRDLVVIAGLLRVFDVYDAVPEAVQAFTTLKALRLRDVA